MTAASDGLEGVEMATKLRFDLILLTALPTQALIDQALEEGVFAVHHKPFDVWKLTNLVRIVMMSTCVLVVDDQPETRTAMHAIPEDSATRYPKLRTGTKRFPRLEKPTSTSYSWMLSCQVWTNLPPSRRSSKKPGCKKIFLTGHTVVNWVSQALSTGKFSLLTKPVEMISAIKSVVETNDSGVEGS